MNQKKILSNLSWNILPGKLINPGIHHELYEKTYKHWRQMWTEILDVKENLNSDSFLRQDLVCPLTIENSVVGLICCTFFNKNQQAYSSHSYISDFPKDIFKNNFDGELIMSIEYLTVHPEFRKSFLDVSLGDVLLGLSMKIFENSVAQAVLGTARSKIHVDQMCYRFGFKPFGEINKFGHPCTLIITDRSTLQTHPELKTQKLIDQLWDGRNDISIDENKKLKIA
ncbi:MAG: hypothetical protein V4596_06330 [Bdellovibrionota bacterium]